MKLGSKLWYVEYCVSLRRRSFPEDLPESQTQDSSCDIDGKHMNSTVNEDAYTSA